MLFTGGNIVTPTAVIPDGWLLVSGGRIAALGTLPPGGLVPADPRIPEDAEQVPLAGRWLLPGFIDLHVHGGGGAAFDSIADDPTAIERGLALHRRHGTTRSLVSLVTAPLPSLTRTTAAAAEYVAGDPHALGLHLEGPFLSELRRGVHPAELLLDPEPVALQQLLDAGAGQVRVLTLAPERPGGLDAVRQLVDAGVHAAVGHSDAGYDVAAAAFAAGADLVTHAFNGMRPLHHRDPGIVAAAMDSPTDVVIEAINDGVHLHPATVRLLRSIAPDRLALITDAMGAAGASDGEYRLAGLPVRVVDGTARLVPPPDAPAGTVGSIAGSTLTMDRAVALAVQRVGMPVLDAVNAASLVPARLLGVTDDYGSVATGRVADLVIADADFTVCAVLAAGRWADERRIGSGPAPAQRATSRSGGGASGGAG